MSSERLLPIGEYHMAACAMTPATAPIGEAFKPVQDELKACLAKRQEAELGMILPRVMVRFAEADLEAIIRGVVFAAQTLDGTSSGPVKTALVPEGVNHYTRPRGEAQKAVAKKLLHRLLNQPAAAPLVEQQRPLLEAGIAKFDDALKARLLAATQLAEARAREDGAREAWVSAYVGNIGAVQGIFKRQRSQRELYFDRFYTASAPELSDEPEDGGQKEGIALDAG
jgi:hypothetical protein